MQISYLRYNYYVDNNRSTTNMGSVVEPLLYTASVSVEFNEELVLRCNARLKSLVHENDTVDENVNVDSKVKADGDNNSRTQTPHLYTRCYFAHTIHNMFTQTANQMKV
jgi:hypothetical protein